MEPKSKKKKIYRIAFIFIIICIVVSAIFWFKSANEKILNDQKEQLGVIEKDFDDKVKEINNDLTNNKISPTEAAKKREEEHKKVQDKNIKILNETREKMDNIISVD
jgi:hypothetical protein